MGEIQWMFPELGHCGSVQLSLHSPSGLSIALDLQMWGAETGSLFEIGRSTKLKITGRYLGTDGWLCVSSPPSPLSCSGVYFQGTTIGMAPIMSMCTAEQSGGVVMVSGESTALKLAQLVWHRVRFCSPASRTTTSAPFVPFSISGLFISPFRLLVNDSFHSEKPQNIALKHSRASLQEVYTSNCYWTRCWGAVKEENQKMYLLYTWAYLCYRQQQSILNLLLYWFYSVFIEFPVLGLIFHLCSSGFIALPDSENKQWQHLFHLSLSQGITVVVRCKTCWTHK